MNSQNIISNKFDLNWSKSFSYTWFRSSLLLMNDSQIYKHYNSIKTKLNWKLFTKVIKRPSKGRLGLDTQSALIRRKV
jgi:hypothetical protein